MFGILPFLIHWFALSQWGAKLFQVPTSTNPHINHWTLLGDLQRLSESDIEPYLPQLCNILLDRESMPDQQIYDYLEKIMVSKCSTSMNFGFKLCGLLKASATPPSEGLFRNLLSNSGSIQKREELLRRFQHKVEYATSYGYNLPPIVSSLRHEYYRDYTFLLDTLSRLGIELKSYPVHLRNLHLRRALKQCNALLFYRMLSQRSISSIHTSLEEIQAYRDLRIEQIASLCPQIASYSLHLPLQLSHENTCRILRFVEEECELLQSKERCPYVVVVELLEQSYPCGSSSLYTDGKKVELKHLDALTGPAEFNRHSQAMQRIKAPHTISHFPLATLPSPASNPSVSQPIPSINTLTQSIDEKVFSSPQTNRVPSSFSTSSPPTSPSSSPLSSEGEEETKREQLFSMNQLYQFNQTIPPNPDLRIRPFDQAFDQSSAKYINIDQYRGGSMNSNNYQYTTTTTTSSSSSNPTFSFPPPLTPSLHPLDSQPIYYVNPDPQPIDLRPPTTSNLPTTTSTTTNKINSWQERKAQIKQSSPFGQLPGWNLKSFIIKSGDDLRKETLAMQILNYCKQVFETEDLDIFLQPYQIISTGYQAGLVEFIEGAISIDFIKKQSLKSESNANNINLDASTSTFSSINPLSMPSDPRTTNSLALQEYFQLQFGASYSFVFIKAVQNFVKSLVGYSLLTYLLQVKDRHNANILIDTEGHLIHIDYGFILGDSPGFNMNFESAPFKLTKEYIDLMGGVDSPMFALFEELFVKGFLALQKHLDGLLAIVQLYYGDKRKGAADGIRTRLLFPTSHSDILSLVRDSLDNWRTKQYDWFQQRSNNIQM